MNPKGGWHATNLIESFSQITLISVEYDCLLRIVFSHHFQRDTRNGRLEVGLLGVNHYADIQIFGSLDSMHEKKNERKKNYAEDWRISASAERIYNW